MPKNTKTPKTVKIGKLEIATGPVLTYIGSQGRYVTSVELRDKFNWPLRETARRLMKVLMKTGAVIIAANPNRARSYVYGLPGQPKPKKTEAAKTAEETAVEDATEATDEVVESAEKTSA